MRGQLVAVSSGTVSVARARRSRGGITVTLVASVMLGGLAGIAHAQQPTMMQTTAQTTTQTTAQTITPTTGQATPQTTTAAQVGVPVPGHLDASIGVRGGTLGFGVEAGKLIFSHLGVRAGINLFNYGVNGTISDLAYNARLRYQNVPVMLDFFPWARGNFHLTGGVVFDQNRITGTGQPDESGNISINHTNYSQSQVGVLSAAVRYPSTAGYAGLGFGTPARNSLMAFVVDLGAMISTPQVAVSATGAGSNPQLASDVQAQQTMTQQKVNQYAHVYPVISMGLVVKL